MQDEIRRVPCAEDREGSGPGITGYADSQTDFIHEAIPGMAGHCREEAMWEETESPTWLIISDTDGLTLPVQEKALLKMTNRIGVGLPTEAVCPIKAPLNQRCPKTNYG